MPKLTELKKGDKGTVVRIMSRDLELILTGLGLRPGDSFELTDMAPWGGPLALRLQGTKIALRIQDAAAIEVNVN